MASNKISFFENIFYWPYNWGEIRNEQALKRDSSLRVALPERSFALISLYQYIYFMFFISLILHTLNDETIVKLYEIDEHLTIVPLVAVYLILLFLNAIIFNEKKYNMLKEKYAGMSKEEKQTRKKTSVIFAIVSLLIGIVTIKLWLLYDNKVEEVVKMGL